jgi:hypothetical protein
MPNPLPFPPAVVKLIVVDGFVFQPSHRPLSIWTEKWSVFCLLLA